MAALRFEITLRVLVEFVTAVAAAEKDRGAAIGAADFGRSWINAHAADRIFAIGTGLALLRWVLIEFLSTVVAAEKDCGAA
ncbi:MAG: hypothetical protein VXA52_00720, partial [Synechococcus sp.]